MNFAAIHHEATQRWCHAIAPDTFIIRLQTAKDDCRNVRIHTRDKYIPLNLKDTRKSYPMHLAACDSLRDYYEVELSFHMVCMRYCFELEDQQGHIHFLANDGFVDRIPEDKERHFDCCQNLREEELFQIPQWAKHGVIYQVFPSRFAADRPVKDRVWYQAPIGPFADLGGNLRGVIQHLDHIRDLGADILYMTPIFRSKSSHKYDTIDYYAIDPSFGTEADLIELVDKAHSMGLRVILDAVFNHTGPDFFAFADLKKNQEESPYRDWYYPESFPLRMIPRPNYKCFGYFGHMPKVNLRNPDAARYFTDVALYWLDKAKIDGWRLDVADEVSHSFWQNFRREIKAKHPDALIVGEIWHHAPDFLQGDQWDSMMNYPFYRAVEDFAATGSITASAYLGRLGHIRGNTHSSCYPLLWNLIGSHDTPRLLHRCGEDRRRQKFAAALSLLWPGMPMIYYGDEVGMTGGADPDCRRGMLWDESRQDQDTLNWYRQLIHLRKSVPGITCGRFAGSVIDDDLGLLRVTREWNGEKLTLVFLSRDVSVSLPEYAGEIDLITGETFGGTLSGPVAAVFRS